jgi:hypothetical protein
VVPGSIPLQGKFTLEHKGTSSRPVSFDISARDMELALESIDDVVVHRKGPNADEMISWLITFVVPQNVGDIPLLVANFTMLVPASSSMRVGPQNVVLDAELDVLILLSSCFHLDQRKTPFGDFVGLYAWELRNVVIIPSVL